MDKLYFYEISEGEHAGPVTLDELGKQDIKADTFIWCDGMEEWLLAKDIPEVADLFNWAIEPAMHTPPPLPKRAPEPDSIATPEPTPEPIPQPEENQQQYSNDSIPPKYDVYEAKPSSYLVWSIITAITCCWPFSIPAIIYASQVDNKWNSGDHEGARKSSKYAKIWCLVSMGTAILFIVLYLIFIALIVIFADNSTGNLDISDIFID